MAIGNPYDISSEYNITQLLEHFDSPFIMAVVNEKIDKLDFSAVLDEPNIVEAYEENFKSMLEDYPGDSDNIKGIRIQVYTDIINTLCQRFGLQFNEDDDNIDRFTAAFYLYDFLVCNRCKYIVNFFTSYIVNNRDSLARSLDLEGYNKGRDSAAAYGKAMHTDPLYGAISANLMQVIGQITTFNISLLNIFQSVYVDTNVVTFLDNIVADTGNFFETYYCNVTQQPEIAPIVITNIRLNLQKVVGKPATSGLAEFMNIASN